MKKKNKKFKIISSFIILVLLFFATKVDAVTITTDASKKGTIDPDSEYVTNKATLTIHSYYVLTNDNFKAYKLLNTFYNASSNEITYEFTDSFKAYLLSTDTYKNYTVDDYFKLTSGLDYSGTGSLITTSTLDKLVSGYPSFIKENSVVGTDMTLNGNNSSALLEAGAYLVLPVSTTKVYSVMVGNLDFQADGTEWRLNNETIWAKISDVGLTKTVSGINNKNIITSEYTYTIVGTVPSYPTNAINKTYKIEDTLGSGITFSGISNMTIKNRNAEYTGTLPTYSINSNGSITDNDGNVVGTITYANQKLTINFDGNYLITPMIMEITYKAKMNNNAVLGDTGNKNSVILTYSNSPYTMDTYTTEPVEVNTKIYGIELLSYAGSDKNAVLENAQFDVFSDEALNTKVGSITTDNQGIGRLKGLTEGTYYLKATKAPTGYQLLREVVTVKVKVDGSIEGETEGYYRTEISNAEAGILPYTGGFGILIYSLVGIVIIGIGTFIAIKIQKKKAINVE